MNKQLVRLDVKCENDEVVEVEMPARYLESLARRRGGVLAVLYRFVQMKRDERADYNPEERVKLFETIREYHDSRSTLSDEEAQAQMDQFTDYVQDLVDKMCVLQDLQFIHELNHEVEMREAAKVAVAAGLNQPQPVYSLDRKTALAPLGRRASP